MVVVVGSVIDIVIGIVNISMRLSICIRISRRIRINISIRISISIRVTCTIVSIIVYQL